LTYKTEKYIFYFSQHLQRSKKIASKSKKIDRRRRHYWNQL